MNLELYDVFSKVIPGGLIISILIFCGWIPYPVDNSELIYLVMSYFLGYVVDAVSYEFQDKFLRKFNAKFTFSKIFSEYKHISEISEKYGLEKWQSDNVQKKYSRMFHESIKNDRTKSFQNHWVGARNIFIAYTICLVILLLEVQELQIAMPKWVCLVVFLLFIEVVLLNHARNRQNLMFVQVLNCYYAN